MKKNGFTLLELLIGISLISVVMVFLFRLIHDVQNEGLSNTYIVANQTNRDEIIAKTNKIIYENGTVCKLSINKLGGNNTLTFKFCNDKELLINVTRERLTITYNSQKYNYPMKDPKAYYDPNITYTTFSFNGKNYVKVNIVTTKKGQQKNTIDDVEIVAFANNISMETGIAASYSYTGSYDSFVAEKEGLYKIELWGAQGGNSGNALGGRGAYTKGVIWLSTGDTLYVYVGGQGTTFNGGATGREYGYENSGGATDVRLQAIGVNALESLASRIMVAAGGGGAGRTVAGGAGGALIGIEGGYTVNSFHAGQGGTQTSGGLGGTGEAYTGYNGTFGAGANSPLYSSAGGGGYYGGGSSGTNYDSNGAGGGGSSYISGYTGCVAVTSAIDISPKEGCTDGTTDNVCSIHYSGREFTQTQMSSGNQSMPTYDGSSTMVGNTGNGYAKITYMSE